MAGDFPTTKHAFTDTSCGDTRTPSSVINALQDETAALETKVGVDSSAVATSIDYLLKNTSSSNPGHKHTLADGATDVSASAAEINTLDGVTASTADLNATTNFEETISSTTSEVTIATAKTLNITDNSGLKLANTAVTSTAAELNYVDTTAGTVEASKAVVVDASKDITFGTGDITATDITVTGTLDVDAVTGDWGGWTVAGETWTYASADAPVYTFTIATDLTGKYSAGMKVKLTQSADGVKYGIIVKDPTYGAPNTTVTIYMGTDYDLDNAAITSPFFSMMRAPHGFPMDRDKWTIEVTTAVDANQATPTVNTWYNIGSVSINVPIGSWFVYYDVTGVTDKAGTATNMFITLSTTNNGETDSEWTTRMQNNITGASNVTAIMSVGKRKDLTLTTKDTYYLNGSTGVSGVAVIGFDNDESPLIIRAVCTYL